MRGDCAEEIVLPLLVISLYHFLDYFKNKKICKDGLGDITY